MKILKKADIIAVLLCLSAIIPGAAVYSRLPARIVTNWTLNAEENGSMPKAVAVFVLPVVFAVIELLSCIYLNRLEEKQPGGKHTAILRILFPVILFLSQGTILLHALGKLSDPLLIACTFVSVVMIVLGNYMPKFRRNWLVGIRTPHIVSDETIWYQTHRLAGFTVTGGGVLSLVTSLLGLVIATFVILVLSLLIPMLYGERLYYARKRG